MSTPWTKETGSQLQFSSVCPLMDCVMWEGKGGGHEGQFSRHPLPAFSAGGPCEKFWNSQLGSQRKHNWTTGTWQLSNNSCGYTRRNLFLFFFSIWYYFFCYRTRYLTFKQDICADHVINLQCTGTTAKNHENFHPLIKSCNITLLDMYLFPLLHIYLFNVFWHIFEGFLFLPANEFLLVLAVLKIVHRDICIVVLLLLLFSPPVFFSSVSSTKQISYLPATLAYPVLHSSQTHAVVFLHKVLLSKACLNAPRSVSVNSYLFNLSLTVFTWST